MCVNEIADSKAEPILSGTRGRPGPESLCEIPGSTDLTITLDGAALQAAAQRTLSLFGPGYTLEVDGITLGPGQQDTVTVKARGRAIVYTTQQPETPDLMMGIQTASEDYLFEIRVHGGASGQSVQLVVDQVSGRLKVQVDGHDTADYDIDLSMHRLGASGDESSAYVGDQAIRIASGGSVSICYGTWTGSGSTPTLEVDSRRCTPLDRP